MDYINFKINNKHFIQRNQFSKLTINYPNGTKEILDSYEELSNTSKNIVEDSILIKQHPERYFEYSECFGDEICIKKYIGKNLENVVIPSEIDGKKVVILNNQIFAENNEIKILIIPDSVVEVGSNICYNMPNLLYVNISSQLKYIPFQAFANCENLKFINTENIEKINSYAFKNCKELKTINFKKVKTIENSAFENCTNLMDINAPHLSKIGANAFFNCKKIRTAILSDDLKVLNSQVFAKCSNLKNFKMPNNLILIADNAFCRCVSLKDVIFPDTLKTIDIYAFANTGLTGELTFPKDIEFINPFAFIDTNIDKVNISKNTKYSDLSFPVSALTNLNLYDVYNTSTITEKDTIIK